MVILFPGGVPAAPLVPAVLLHLPQAVSALPAQNDASTFQQVRRHPDAVGHVIHRPHHGKALPPQRLNEAGRRRVHDDPLNVPPRRQLLEVHGVFRVCFLPPLLPGIEIPLRHPVPNAVQQAPKPKGRRVGRTVVHGDAPLAEGPLRCRHRVPLPVEKVIDQALGRRPLPQYEPPVEHPRISPAVAGPDTGRQSGVVIHGKMEVQCPPLLRF